MGTQTDPTANLELGQSKSLVENFVALMLRFVLCTEPEPPRVQGTRTLDEQIAEVVALQQFWTDRVVLYDALLRNARAEQVCSDLHLGN